MQVCGYLKGSVAGQKIKRILNSFFEAKILQTLYFGIKQICFVEKRRRKRFSLINMTLFLFYFLPPSPSHLHLGDVERRVDAKHLQESVVDGWDVEVGVVAGIF